MIFSFHDLLLEVSHTLHHLCHQLKDVRLGLRLSNRLTLCLPSGIVAVGLFSLSTSSAKVLVVILRDLDILKNAIAVRDLGILRNSVGDRDLDILRNSVGNRDLGILNNSVAFRDLDIL